MVLLGLIISESVSCLLCVALSIRYLASRLKRRTSVAPLIRQQVLCRKNVGAFDIHTLLLCPDPARVWSKSYEMIKVLGKGGFGSVYKVRHLPTNEQRAAKLVGKPEDKAELDFILTELQLLITLDHPNIEKFYEYFEERSVICFITELCTGGNLGDLDVNVDDYDEIRCLFRDVMGAVAYCHSSGVAHRDLKFENCMLTDGESGQWRRTAKIIDFGLSSIRRNGDTSRRWMRDPVGTAYYVAPEVIGGGGLIIAPYGMECDVWSIGVMLYVVLTTKHPFSHGTSDPEVLMGRVCRCPMRVTPLDEANVDLTARSLLEELLVKDPHRRLGAKEALGHPWFHERTPNCRCPVSPKTTKPQIQSMISKAKSFAKYTKFEEAVLTLVAHEARSRDVKQLRQAFLSLDPYHAGWLSRDGFKKGIRAQGISLPEADMETVLAALDPDMDDKIQYTDWLAATIDAAAITSQRAMREVFHFFDLHGLGRVSLSDLTEVLGEELAMDVLHSVNKDPSSHSGDDTISWEEFQLLMLEVARKLETMQRGNSDIDTASVNLSSSPVYPRTERSKPPSSCFKLRVCVSGPEVSLSGWFR